MKLTMLFFTLSSLSLVAMDDNKTIELPHQSCILELLATDKSYFNDPKNNEAIAYALSYKRLPKCVIREWIIGVIEKKQEEGSEWRYFMGARQAYYAMATRICRAGEVIPDKDSCHCRWF